MPHYISPSLRSFCLLKVAHLFDCVSLTVLSGLLGDLDSALSVISLSILFSLLSLLPSSQLGHIVQLALRDLPLLSLRSSFPPLLIGSLLSFPSPLPSLTLLSPLIPSLFSPSSFLLRSQLGHIVQLALWPCVPFCSFSPSLSLRLFSSSLPLLPLPFIIRPFLPLLYLPTSLRSPACGILLSSLHSSASLSFSLPLWIRLGILSGSSLGSLPLPSLLLSCLRFFLRSPPLPLPAVSLGILSGSLLLSSLALLSPPYYLPSPLTLPSLSLLDDVLPY